MYKRLPNDNIFKLAKFSLTHEFQKQLLVQGFILISNSPNKLVELCKRLDIDKGVLQYKVDGTQ